MKAIILIVDDDKSIREALARALGSIGYETLLAANGNEAIEIFQKHRPDLVLLDLNMPVKNGWDTFENISTQHPLTPVIIITGRPGQLEMAVAARVGALLEKPLDVPLLLNTVQQMLDEPLSQRLSRLACGIPGILYYGADDPGQGATDELDLTELRAVRKKQMDDLRSFYGN
ncbi:response regulator [Verrucomicrobiota bacterium sgz303538]